MNKNLTKKKKKGFTLIELIVVIAILGVLAAVAIPRFASKTDEAKYSADNATARNIAMAIKTEIAVGETTIATTTTNTKDDAEELPDVIKKYFDNKAPISKSQDDVEFKYTRVGDEIKIFANDKEFYPTQGKKD